MTTTDSPVGSTDSSRAVARPLPAAVDWIAAVLIALFGGALSVGGAVLTLIVDRAMLAEGIESGRITVALVERDLTQAEMLTVATDVVTWTGVGLLVTGLGLVAFAVGFAVSRRRSRRRGDGDGTGGAPSYRVYAVHGAVATALLSFLPFSPVLGGGLAAYVGHGHTDRALAIGALSGVLAAVPVLAVLVFVTVGLFTGLSAVGAGLALVMVAVVLFSGLVTAAYGAGLGALGGFLGRELAAR